ncbi:MAG: hypothetical protein AB1352_01680 [Patescibacteria group bacterium]
MTDYSLYHYFKELSLGQPSNERIAQNYDKGYVLTRLGPHIMRQVRSVRVPCEIFQLSSENRRIMRKYTSLALQHVSLPFPRYHWSMGKMAVDFYRNKSGVRAMSAQRVKTLFTSSSSSMNGVFLYQWKDDECPIGYCLSFSLPPMLHYAYPFYDTTRSRAFALPSLGMAMMLKAILWAQEKQMSYVYLGSIQDERSLYKFQFKGVEWWDGEKWRPGKPKKSQIQSSKFK